MCGDGWGKGGDGTYAKFYVNPPWSQLLPHLKEQAIVRPSLHQPLGPVSVRRRSAARGCADAHTAPAPPVVSLRGFAVRRVELDFRRSEAVTEL